MRRTGQRPDRAVRRDLADRVVVCVRHEDVARAIHRQAGREEKARDRAQSIRAPGGGETGQGANGQRQFHRQDRRRTAGHGANAIGDGEDIAAAGIRRHVHQGQIDIRSARDGPSAVVPLIGKRHRAGDTGGESDVCSRQNGLALRRGGQ